MDEFHPIFTDVVQPADKRAHEISAGLGCHNGLRCREHERHIDANMLVGEHLCGFQPFLRHRTLHNDVAMKLRQMPALLDHSRRVTAYGFRADRPVYDRANLKKLVFERISFFRNQCGIRGNTIENACAGGVADLFDVCSIKEEFHG